MEVVRHNFKRKNLAAIFSADFPNDLLKTHLEFVYQNLAPSFG
jgi:hypothetical protein